MNTSGITPKDLNVLVLPDPAEETSKGGIIIPEKVQDRQKFATMKGTLVAVGANAFREWGDAEAGDLQPGRRILMAQYAGRTVKGVDGKDYTIMKDEDVLALLAVEPAHV